VTFVRSICSAFSRFHLSTNVTEDSRTFFEIGLEQDFYALIMWKKNALLNKRSLSRAVFNEKRGPTGAIHQSLRIILNLRILVLLPVSSTLPYVVRVKNSY
jgi:hypothetical protein